VKLPFRIAGLSAILWFLACTSWARLGVDYQMALGNPSGAVTDPVVRTNYLISRSQFVLSYNDDTHQANWVSWSYSLADDGTQARTDAWAVEELLPSGYLKIGTSTFGTYNGISLDRGHMCPSADRTTTYNNNAVLFRMSNIIPQAAANNQGLWAQFEDYCRTLAAGGSEVLIICGPSEFTGGRISNQMSMPGSVWKIAVVIPSATSTTPANQRINTSCRVLAILTPNVSTGLGSWQSYLTSVEVIEAVTGYKFFSNVDSSVATYLKNVVDTGTGPNQPTVITGFSPATGPAGTTVTISGYNFGTSPVVDFNGVVAVASVSGGTTITVTVPALASTGPITVTASGGTDTSATDFTVATGTEPALGLSKGIISSLASIEGSSGTSQSYTVSGSNLTGSITVTAPTNFEISLNNSIFAGSQTISPTSGSVSQAVYVRIKSTAPLGSVSGTITHSGGGATTQNLSVSGTVTSNQPSLTLSTTSLTGFSALQGSVSTSKSYTVSGVNLSGAITVTPPAGYEISTNNSTFVTTSVSLTPSGTTLGSTTIYTRIHSSASLGTVSGLITHSGGGATSQNLSVSGTVTAYTPGQSSDVYWNFNTETPTSGVPIGLTVGPILQGNNNGTTPLLSTSSVSSGYTGASGSNNVGAAARTNALNTGTNGSAYFEISITPNTNVSFALTKISFGSRSTGTGPQAYTLRSSADGYASEIKGGTFLADGNWALKSNNNLTFSAQTAITFRLFGYNGTGSPTTSTANWRVDDLTMTVSAEVPAVAPVITSTNAVTATNYVGFSYQITASNNPVSYNASGLPSGLTIDTTNGLISGTSQATPGTYTVGLSAINSAGEGTKNLTLTLLKNSNAPTITSASSAAAYLRSAFSFSVAANPAATSYGMTGLPPGLTSSAGTITGTPTATGTYNVSITASNAFGSDSQTLVLSVLDPVLNLSASSLTGLSSILGKEGSIRTYTISGTNLTSNVTITAPTSFTISDDSITFTETLSFAPVNGALAAKTLYVRLATNAPLGASSGTVTHSGGGAVGQNLSVAGTVIQPQLTLSINSLGGLSTRVGVASASQSYTVSGTELTGGITVASPAGFEVSTDDANFTNNLLLLPSAGSLNAQRIYVRISLPSLAGSLVGSILHEGGDAASQSLDLSGSVVQPSLGTSVASLNPFSANAGSVSTSQNYTLSGSHLTGPITVTAPANFEISLNNSSFAVTQSLTNNGTLSAVPIYVRISTNAVVGAISGSISHSGGDAAAVSVAVSGMVQSITPTLSLSASSLTGFGSVSGTPSFSQSYIISGVILSNVVTVSAPAAFEVSVDNTSFSPTVSLSPVSGTLSNVSLYVRLAASATVGNYTGAVSHTSTGATTRDLSVSGTVSSPTPTLSLSTTSLAGFSTIAGTVSGNQSYVLSGSSLKGAITVSSPTNFEIGTATNSFASSLTLVPSGGVLSNTALYVRIKTSASAGTLTEAVTHSGGGASNQILALSGSVSATGPVFSSPMTGSVYTNSSFSTQLTVGGTNTNATYVFSASGLPTGFGINATNGNITGTGTNVSRTNFFTVTASNSNGVSTGTYRLRTMTAAEQDAIPLTAVINKFWNNGSSDKIEILVTGYTNQAPPLDMRGMTIKDFNNNMGNDQGGKYVFNDVALWSRVKAGTLIVLSAGTSSAEDFDPSDFVLRVNLGNTTYFNTAAGGFDLGNIEMVMIKTADAGSDGSAGGIHLLAVGSPGTQYNNFKGKKMNNTQSLNSGSRTMVWALNSNASLADFYSSNGAGTSSTLVFGSPNSTGNTTFINALRAKDQDGPVITVAGSNPVTIAHGSTYMDAGASALDGSTNRAVSTNNPVNPNVVGTYVVTYSSSDAAGNTSTASRTVYVTDQTPPLITLVGSSSVQLTYGSIFSDPGATATDAVDGNVNAYVQVMRPYTLASVGWAAGTYTLSYVVSDTAGNVSQTLTRTVQVVKATPSITAVPTASAITLGQTLGNSTLSGGLASVPGSFAWTDTSTVPSASANYQVTFMPTDSVNYNTVTFSVSVTVNPAKPVGTTYSGWLNGASASDAAFLDYVFGAVTPGTLDPSLKPTVAVTGGNLVLTYYTREGTTGLTVTPKTSADLAAGSGDWVNVIPVDVGVPRDVNGVSVQQKTASVAVSGVKKFLRIEAAQQ